MTASSRARRLLVLGITCLSFALSAAGCSSERLIGWTVTRRLDDYLDFSSEQKQAARTRVDETLVVMRERELPHWLSLMRDVRDEIRGGLTADQLTRLDQRYRTRLDAGVDLIAPRIAPLLSDLSPDQRSHFVKRMREDVNEQYEDTTMAPDERRAEGEKKALKALERFVGDLSEAQEASVRAIFRKLPDERATMRKATEARIARIDGFLAKKPAADAVESELRSMWAQRDDGLGDPAARRAWQHKAMLEVYALLNREQREHAAQMIDERIKMLRNLLES